ncbi:MAG: DUF2461 domain-containing protein [Candidatus Hodarchaeales archaeon]|jgi:uncharacterized protein (TIGR02453 family)
MKDLNKFPGFPKETIDFLINLKLNNNREWFNNHKQEYFDYFIEPAKSFVVSLGESLQKHISEEIKYDLRLNGSGSIMRIYRDIRFKKDKTPYNTRLRTIFWEGTGKKMKHPGFFIGFDASGGNIYGGLHRFDKPSLERYREAVVSEKGIEIERIITSLRNQKYKVGGEHYKRIPQGFDKSYSYANLLLYNGLYAVSPPIEPVKFTKPEIINDCTNHCKNMTALHSLLVKIVN